MISSRIEEKKIEEEEQQKQKEYRNMIMRMIDDITHVTMTDISRHGSKLING